MAWNPQTGFGKFIDWLTFGLFSKNDDGSSNGIAGLFNPKNWKNAADDIVNSDDFLPGQEKSLNDSIGSLFGTSGIGGLIQALTNRYTAAQLTGAEREQNQFNAEQAAIDRQFQQDMSNTAYQRSVADMRAAGVNPALAMQQGGASSPSGSTASGSGSGQLQSMSDLMQLLLLKKQGKLLDAQAQQARNQGEAAVRNASSSERQAFAAESNAEANLQNAEANLQNAETNRVRANNEIRIGNSTIELNSAKVSEIEQSIRESVSRIELQDIEKLAKNLDYQFSMETFETNKELLIQQLAYRAIEMSNIQQMTEESRHRILAMDAETAGIQWQKDHPQLAAGLGIASGFTGVIGNVLKGSVSAVVGKWAHK